MTDGFTGRKNHGRGHSYWIDGVKVTGVTTILNAGLPKPALVKWAATSAAERAIDEWDELAKLGPAKRMQRIADAPNDVRNAGGVRGSRVHALAEPLSRGEQVTVPDELAGRVESCVKFLNDFEPAVILAEFPSLSRRWSYGGTGDLIAEINGKTWLLDWKTNKSGPFGDTAFQLAAYRFGEFTIAADGTEQPLPPIDECGVVWIRDDGYELYPYHADEGVWREFLYIMQTAKAAENCKDYRGDPMLPPVRGIK